MTSPNPRPETSIAETRQTSDTLDFRSHMGKISRQSAVFFAGTLFSVATAYLFKIYLARALGAEGLGLYTLGMTLVGFLGLFNALGLPQAAVRFVAAYTATGQRAQLRTFLGRSVALLVMSNLTLGTLLLLIGPWAVNRFYREPGLSRYLVLFAAIMSLGCMTSFFGQVLAGFKDVARRTIITNFIGNPLMMVFSLVMIAAGFGLRGYLIAQVASAAIVAVLLIVGIWKVAAKQSSPAPSPTAVNGTVLSFSIAALGVAILDFVLAQADKILIGFWLNAHQVGIYAVATSIVTFVPIALQSVNQIFSPTISDLHSRSQLEMLGRLFQTLTKWILALTLPLAAVVILFAAPLMGIFGAEFQSGWTILVIGVLGQLVNCGVGSVGYLLLMSGHQFRLVRVQTAMALFMLGTSAAFIPWFGITGAALAAAITNVLSNLLYLKEVKRTLGISPYNRSYLHMLAPMLVMVSTMLLLKSSIMSIRPFFVGFLLALVAAYTAFLSVMILLGLNSDDRLVVASVWAKLRGTLAFAEAA